ncbi:MAG: hypothetical protein ACOCU6_00015 [Nanoarchaeota archaeon]
MNNNYLPKDLMHDYCIGILDRDDFCIIDLKSKHMYTPVTYEDIVDVLEGIINTNDTDNIGDILRPGFYILPSTTESYIRHSITETKDVVSDYEVSPDEIDTLNPSQIKEIRRHYKLRTGKELDIRSKKMGNVLLPEYSPLEHNNFVDNIPFDQDITNKGVEQKILAYQLHNKELKNSN